MTNLLKYNEIVIDVTVHEKNMDIYEFIDRCVRIKFPCGTYEKMILNNVQKNVLFHWMSGEKLFEASCPRQVGISTLIVIYSIFMSLSNQMHNICIISSNTSSMMNLRRMFSDILVNVKYTLGVELIKDDKTSIEFENGSRIILLSSTSNTDSIRERSVDIAFLMDFKYFTNYYEWMKCIMPMMYKKTSKLFFNSSKNSESNIFSPLGTKIKKYDFMFNQDKDVYWALNMVKHIGYDRFEEEYMI